MIITRCDGGCGMESPGPIPSGAWMMIRARQASEFLKSAANEPDKVYCPMCWAVVAAAIVGLPPKPPNPEVPA